MTGPGHPAAGEPGHRSVQGGIAVCAVFLLALIARVGIALHGGGLLGNYGYDASVYYAASDGLLHGRLPYRDFVLLHPPAMMLALTPFALVGRIFTDHTGFIAANLGFSALGAIDAALVVVVARRMGLGLWAATAGGVFYAFWYGSVQAEYLARLEPLGNFFVLVGLFAYTAAGAGSRRWYVACGAAFGVAASVKIWWAVPLIVVLVWIVADRRPRGNALAATAGAAASLLVVNGVFFLLAPGQMWRMVVTEQLDRGRSPVSAPSRLQGLVSLGSHVPAAVAAVGESLLGVAILALLVLAVRIRPARLVLILTVVQLALLLTSPAWFRFYGDYLAPVLALSIAAGASVVVTVLAGTRREASRPGPDGRRTTPSPRRRGFAAAAAALLFAVVLVTPSARAHPIAAFPGRRLAASVATTHCVMADTPMALIELDALSRDFRDGCRMWVDVTGRTYGPDKGPIPRSRNRKWQADLRTYLLSGDALITSRGDTGISRSTLRYLHRGGVLARAGHYVIYRSR
jgi:alpha-1,2-mannosyltransferase